MASDLPPMSNSNARAVGGAWDVGDVDDAGRIVVYRRSGCGFCTLLRRGLRRAGVATVERDIWADPNAAAFVRAHAEGNETVPTVDVAGTVLVNPSVRQVLAAARAAGISVPDLAVPWWRRLRRPQPEGSG